MTDKGRVMVASAGGALVGGLVGYLCLTDAGRRLRSQIEPRLDDAMREMARLRQTITKAQSVAAEGWRSLNQVTAGFGEDRERGVPRQTSPY